MGDSVADDAGKVEPVESLPEVGDDGPGGFCVRVEHEGIRMSSAGDVQHPA